MPDQLGDDGRTGLDRGWPAARRRPAGTLVRERLDEADAIEDALQRVPDQRIGSPQGTSRRSARLAGEARPRVTSTNSLPPASDMGRPAVSWNGESPRGFTGSVIIC